MGKTGVNFFEEHVEKIVLAVVGVVCFWLFVFHVVISPNKVEYDGQKHGAGELDQYILERHGKPLERNVSRAPDPPQAYTSPIPKFIALVESPVEGIDAGLYLPQPIYSTKDYGDKRRYRIPWIGEIAEAQAGHIRAVAHVPIQEVTEEYAYDPAGLELRDIDLVTVEGKFDTVRLYERFEESFAGYDVPAEWRDPCLAKPVFAKVLLERQELLPDGSWSEWQAVRRTKIDPYKQMFEVIEAVEDQPHGWLRVRQLHFDNSKVRKYLLQPDAYRIASANEEWFPPSLHSKYVAHWEEIKDEEKRRAREAEREEREREREEARKEREQELGRRRDNRSGVGVGYGPGLGAGTGIYGDTTRGSGTRVGSRTSPRRSTRTGSRTTDRYSEGYPYGDTGNDRRATRLEERERDEREKRRLARKRALEKMTSIRDIYDEYKNILLATDTDLAKLREPLTLWAHDDTVEPGHVYRYRLRLGVFNPIAGTERFVEQSAQFKDKAILWSEFSDVTEDVEIPKTLYFFPRDMQEAAKMVTVEVARYVLGYWNSEDFTVKQGEVIGRVVDFEAPAKTATTTSSVSRERERSALSTLSRNMGGEVVLPETVDYDTGAVLVDVISVNDWAGGTSLYARQYFDMLYSHDGSNIEHIPVGTRYWPEELRAVFNDIKQAQKEPRQPFRPWESGLSEREFEPLELLYPEDDYQYELDEGSDESTRSRRPRRSIGGR